MNVLGSVLFLCVLWLSLCPSYGQTTGIEKRQFEQIKAQAERGDAQAQLSLGSMYASGVGVNKDLVKAAKWHRKAAEQGLARAQVRVAFEYANGAGVKPDRMEAVRWLRRAADQNLPEAQYELGVCYSKGDGIVEDAVEATACYRKAADKHYPQAEYALANCYFEGNGVTKDIPQAIEWTRKAAEQGFAPAQNTLGMCYAKGRGVRQDYLEAYKWLNLSAAQARESDVEAKMNLSMAERAMTPQQIAEGQKLAREFKPHVTEPGNPGSAPTKPAAFSPGTTAALATKTGFLTVKADDETSEVFLDGNFVGNTPARLKLDPGTHVIEVKKQGFKDFHKEIKITEGSDLNLRAVLERQ